MTHRTKVFREILLTRQSILPSPLSMNMERPLLGRLYWWLLSWFHLRLLLVMAAGITLWWLGMVIRLALMWCGVVTASPSRSLVPFTRAELTSTFHWRRRRWPSDIPPWRHSAREMFVNNFVVKYYNLSHASFYFRLLGCRWV